MDDDFDMALVVKGKKGHLPEALHCALIRRLQELISPDATVTVAGGWRV